MSDYTQTFTRKMKDLISLCEQILDKVETLEESEAEPQMKVALCSLFVVPFFIQIEDIQRFLHQGIQSIKTE